MNFFFFFDKSLELMNYAIYVKPVFSLNIMAKDGGIAMSRGHTFIYLL